MSEWTIKKALEWTEGYLADKGDENPRLSAQWLLSEACGLSRTQLFVNFDRPLSEDERGVLRDYVRRRGAGEPLQYITGEVAFRHINVKVRPGVLIPRPETEVLVSEVLAVLPTPGPRDVAWNPEAAEQEREAVAAVKKALEEAGESVSPSENTESNETEEDVAVGGDLGRPSSAGMDETRKSLLVADLCTGSGCIACSLAYEHPDVRVIATDVAPEAVALAKENTEALGLADRVAVLQCSLGSGIGEKRMGTFDAVVSNPPYVPTAVMAGIPREVADFEPTLALDGGADGLYLFRPLAQWAARALKPGGVLACELYEGHMDAARAVAEQAGFVDVHIVDDLTGRPRVLVAKR
ncbi:N5-glutamine methyltransferase family protein [Adlercreutzia equolifaciens]|uniref:N5-glutamine methyltransferase family protein n=1 Tax=Adlercreutzia equolifaciens TaxID=446660 RepID=UPI003AF02370